MTPDIREVFCLPDDAAYLEEALTHPSFANEQRQKNHNQRLEFLGDAVLQLCSSEALWKRFPFADEGELTRRRAQLVNTEALAEFARRHGIADALKLGKGAEASGLRESTSVLADTVEALFAVAYLNSGLSAPQHACERMLAELATWLDSADARDPKTELQEQAQARGFDSPTYQLVETTGPAHERWFRVAVTIGGQPLAEGQGRSKRLAEREAAKHALATGLPEPIQALPPSEVNP